MVVRVGLRGIVSSTFPASVPGRLAPLPVCTRSMSSSATKQRCRCWPNPPCHRSASCNYNSFEVYGSRGSPLLSESGVTVERTLGVPAAMREGNGTVLGARTLLAGMMQQQEVQSSSKEGIRLA